MKIEFDFTLDELSFIRSVLDEDLKETREVMEICKPQGLDDDEIHLETFKKAQLRLVLLRSVLSKLK